MIRAIGSADAPGVTPYWLWPWCIFLFLLPFEMVLASLSLSLPLNGLGLGAAFLIAIAAPRANRHQGKPVVGRHMAIALLVLAMHLSFFGSIDPASTGESLILTGLTWVTYLLATASVLSPQQVERSLRAWLWGGGAAALATVACAWMGLEGPDGRGSIVVRGVGMDPNFLTANFLLPAALGFYFMRQKETRMEALMVLGLMGWATVLAESRGGIIALLATGIATLAWERRWKAIVKLLIVVAALYMTFAPMLGRLSMEGDTTGNGRTEVWKVAIDTGMHQGLTGLGFSTFPKVSAQAEGFYWGLAPHNTYLQAFTETGILGLVALLGVMATQLRFPRRTRLAGALTAGLVGLAVAAMFLHFLAFKVLWGAWIVATQVAMAQSPQRPALGRAGTHPPAPSPLVPRTLTP